MTKTSNLPRPVALVTGATQGIGAEYARALAMKGYDLLLVARDQERLASLGSELSKGHGVRVFTESLDLSEPEAANRLYVAARQQDVSPDLLVNNAGFGLYGRFVEMPLPQIRAMLYLHLITVTESIRLFLPAMIERRNGAIINVASVAGFFPIPFLAEYSATKAFLISFSEALAEEVRGTGVHVQVCCPGQTATQFHARAGFHPRTPFRVDSVQAVVKASLAGLSRRRVVVAVGWKGRLLTFLGRHASRKLLVGMARRQMAAVLHEMSREKGASVDA